MDLSKIDLVKAASVAKKLHLRHPVTKELLYGDAEKQKPLTISLLGAKSAEFRAAINETIGQPVQTLDEAERRNSKNLSVITVGWENIGWGNDADGKPKELKFTRQNAEMLYLERPWIREQVDAFASEQRNFWEGSEAK